MGNAALLDVEIMILVVFCIFDPARKKVSSILLQKKCNEIFV